MAIEKALAIDSFNHTFVDGVSGVGKSTLLEDVAIQIIRAGRPLLYVDPHGTSARRIPSYLPKRYSGRVGTSIRSRRKCRGFRFSAGKPRKKKSSTSRPSAPF